MLAVVLLARRCLWVQLGNHGFDLAKVSGKLWRTPAGVLIDAVHACTPVLAHVVHAVVDVDAAVFSFEPRGAITSVVSKVVPANTAVLTWLKLARAKVNLVLAELSGVPPSAGADVAVDAVNAGGVVLATVAFAIVHVHLAPDTRIPLRALAGEPASFHDLTGGAVGARVSVAGVDDGVAVLAVETGSA